MNRSDLAIIRNAVEQLRLDERTGLSELLARVLVSAEAESQAFWNYDKLRENGLTDPNIHGMVDL